MLHLKSLSRTVLCSQTTLKLLTLNFFWWCCEVLFWVLRMWYLPRADATPAIFIALLISGSILIPSQLWDQIHGKDTPNLKQNFHVHKSKRFLSKLRSGKKLLNFRCGFSLLISMSASKSKIGGLQFNTLHLENILSPFLSQTHWNDNCTKRIKIIKVLRIGR